MALVLSFIWDSAGVQRAWPSLHLGCSRNSDLLQVHTRSLIKQHLSVAVDKRFRSSLVYFAEKGLDNDRRSEHGEGRKALDLVNSIASLSCQPVKHIIWKKTTGSFALICNVYPLMCDINLWSDSGSLILAHPLCGGNKWNLETW